MHPSPSLTALSPNQEGLRAGRGRGLLAPCWDLQGFFYTHAQTHAHTGKMQESPLITCSSIFSPLPPSAESSTRERRGWRDCGRGGGSE